jgi:phosphohistidine phosphatase
MAERDPQPDRQSRSLLLLRHAKSAWPDGVPDRERPLARRGERAAELVGRFLAGHGLVPDRIISSPARRAAETAERVLAALDGASGGGPPVTGTARPTGTLSVELDERLYDGDALGAVLDGLAGSSRLLAVGHDPDLVDVARALCGADVRMPTAGLVWLDLHDTPGTQAGSVPSAVVRLVLPPKLLDARPA